MLIVAAVALIASTNKAHAKGLAANHTFDMQDRTMEKLVDQAQKYGDNLAAKLVDNLFVALVDNLSKRREKALHFAPRQGWGAGSRVGGEGDAWRVRPADLENIVLGIPNNIFSPFLPCRALPQSNSRKRRTIMAPVRALPSASAGRLTNHFFEKRVIQCGGEINNAMSKLLTSQLLYLDSVSQKDILMFINSYGGSPTESMEIFDIMNHVRSHVSTNCAGVAASYGALLLAAGQKGKRYSFPNSRIVLPGPPMGQGGGTTVDIDIQTRESMRQMLAMQKHLSQFSGQSLEKLQQDMRTDKYMSADEAVAYGLIDSVVKPKPARPS